MFLFVSHKCDKPQYLGQLKSDLHKIVIKCKNWSPQLINNVFGAAHANMHV